MDVEVLPLLAAQRRLLDTARGFARFREYLDTMLDDGGDVALPLSAFNPMSKAHVGAHLDTLLALDAEGLLRESLAAGLARLPALAGRWRAGWVVVDDAQGGWTDRYLTDADHWFGGLGEVKRGFMVAYSWTGDAITGAGLRAEATGALYRTLFKARYGLPTTLRGQLTLAGLTARFADIAYATDAVDLAATCAILEPHLDTINLPIQFACLYGDDAAAAVGYPPLGVPPHGGFAVALAEARERGWLPDAALLALPPAFGRGEPQP